MNITLISPNPLITNIGIRIISAVLKKEGHKVKLIFTPKNPYKKKRDIRNLTVPEGGGIKYPQENLNSIVKLTHNSDLIGISLMTSFFDDAVQITNELKRNFKTPVVWGGTHPTAKPEECLKYADFVCRGEGEGAIAELAKKIEKGEDCSNIKNICLKDKGGNIILNSLRPLIQDLDTIPFQDYDLKDQYIIIDGKIYEADKIDVKDFFVNAFLSYSHLIYTTRGCPMNCSYCYNSHFNKLYPNQNIFRKRSVDNVINELTQIKKALPFINNTWIIDDNFLGLDDEYIKEFSKKYKQKINLPFALSGVHPSTASREKLENLANAGLMGIRMGIQSASEQTKKLYKRYYANSQAEKTCKIISELKDKIKIVHYDVILENPWETEDNLTETLMFLSKIPLPYTLILFSLTFYPGSDLYDLAKRHGIVKEESGGTYPKHYWKIQPTYFNKLFFLLSDYAIAGKKIHPIIMFLLTNKFFRRTKLNFILYYFLRIGVKRSIEFHEENE